MAAIPPNTYLEGFKKSMCDGIDGAFKKGVKCGRYLEQQERLAADVVPRDEYDALLKRFRHLLESDFIRSFDEYDPRTGTYKRDIVEADNVDRAVRCEHCHAWREDVHKSFATAGFCFILVKHTRPDFYCAYGKKRREDDSE